MKFTLIDLNTWKRSEYLQHYLNNLRNVVSMTVDVDITNLLEQTKKKGTRFFPSFLYIVSKIINTHEEFRLSYDENGQVGIWDEVCPSYIIFHPEDETLTRIFTPWRDDFSRFYQAVANDIDANQSFRGFSIDGVPPNTFDVSCLPWTHYRSFDIHVFDEGTYLAPVITWGKFEENGTGKFILPLSMQIHHAATDGFHICRFFNEVQELCDTFVLP
ncbi:CatA-like O-acetyltransferase [Enterococcus sp. AZ109]|uniref:CatA-like O-acetyltransferase n=1 Tax=Enterococcus sp. AZ109 TaxID=2774634 RepID=UPI003F213587